MGAYERVAAAKPTLPALTGARFLAAFGVVLFHYVPFPLRALAPRWVANMIGNGSNGVTFFFILSGFVIGYNYLEDRDLDRKQFWTARFSRIYPAYLLAFLATAPWYLYHRFSVESGSAASTKSLLAAAACLTMLQAWSAQTMLVWNGPAWSLSVEAFFYGAFPFVATIVQPMRSRRAIAGLILTSCGLTLLPVFAPYILASHPLDPLILYDHPLFCLPLFLLGIGLSKAFSAARGFRHGAWFVNGPAVVLAVLFGTSILADLPVLSRALLVASMGALIFGLACGEGAIARALSLRPITMLGDASYALYILQVPVACLLKTILGSRMDVLSLRNVEVFMAPAQLGLFLCVAVVTSVLVVRYVDKPVRSVLRRALSRRPRNLVPEVATR